MPNETAGQAIFSGLGQAVQNYPQVAQAAQQQAYQNAITQLGTMLKVMQFQQQAEESKANLLQIQSQVGLNNARMRQVMVGTVPWDQELTRKAELEVGNKEALMRQSLQLAGSPEAGAVLGGLNGRALGVGPGGGFSFGAAPGAGKPDLVTDLMSVLGAKPLPGDTPDIPGLAAQVPDVLPPGGRFTSHGLSIPASRPGASTAAPQLSARDREVKDYIYNKQFAGNTDKAEDEWQAYLTQSKTGGPESKYWQIVTGGVGGFLFDPEDEIATGALEAMAERVTGYSPHGDPNKILPSFKGSYADVLEGLILKLKADEITREEFLDVLKKAQEERAD